MLEALTHKSPEQTVTLEFRHDVFKFLFRGKGEKRKDVEKNWMIYSQDDFSRCKLPQGWNCIYDKHGDGIRMVFPVKMRTFLGLSPKGFQCRDNNIVQMQRLHTEKLSVKFIKVTDSCTNKLK